MPRNRKHRRRGRPAAEVAELDTHIRSLGLSGRQAYDEWCQEHGFRRLPHKDWRQMRQEHDHADALRVRAALELHILSLGCASVEDYKDWCRDRDFDPSLDKTPRQQRKEWLRARREAASPSTAPAPLPQTVNNEHLAALGLDSVDQYCAWCRQRGFSESLHKRVRTLRAERELAGLERTRHQTRHLRDAIVDIEAGRLVTNDLRADHLRHIATAFSEMSDSEQRAVATALLLHVERQSDDLLTSWQAIPTLQGRAGNTFVEGVLALAAFHTHWVRPIERWRPDSRNTRKQFHSLACHLLAHYDVPGFMDTAWFLGDAPDAATQQEWFVHLGAGQNIRTATDLPVQLTRRMAHLFTQAPAHYLIREALRWAQVVGQGGDEELVQAILATRLGRSFAEESFWSSVIHFFVRHQERDRVRVARIVEYLQYAKFDTQQLIEPDGTVRNEPPPEPNLSMQSRSLVKLLRAVDSWHQQRTKAAVLPAGAWASSGNGGFSYTEEDGEEPTVWTIQEIVSNRALLAEGTAMRHCVVSHARKLVKGHRSLWSLQARRSGRPRHVMTIEVDNHKGIITQARGRFNAHQDTELAADVLAPPDGPQQPGQTGKLNPTDRDFLLRAHRVMLFWAEREGLTYREKV